MRHSSLLLPASSQVEETTCATQVDNGTLNTASSPMTLLSHASPQESSNGPTGIYHNSVEPEHSILNDLNVSADNVIPHSNLVSFAPMSTTPPINQFASQLGTLENPGGDVPPVLDHDVDSSASSCGHDDIMSDSDNGGATLFSSGSNLTLSDNNNHSYAPTEYMDESESESSYDGDYDTAMAEFQSYASASVASIQIDAHIPHPAYYNPPAPAPAPAPASAFVQSEPVATVPGMTQSAIVDTVIAQHQAAQGTHGPDNTAPLFPGGPPLVPGEEDLPPFIANAGNVDATGLQNYALLEFLRSWARIAPRGYMRRSTGPYVHNVMGELNREVKQVTYSDLAGDECDVQGINWQAIGASRRRARFRRHASYKNYCNVPGSDIIRPYQRDFWIPPTENYFRYRRMFMRNDVHLCHFQLRSVLACPSRSQIYYPTRRGVSRLNHTTGKTEVVLSSGRVPTLGSTFTALDATPDLVMGGTFSGDYSIKSLHTNESMKPAEGRITGDRRAITTHIQIHNSRRSSSPVAAIASNDNGLRIFDLKTEKFLSEHLYGFAVNCSAMSPDRRLRVMVGDASTVSIANTDTGAVEVKLNGHLDYGFSCDWSEDGYTVATGFQDKRVKIWDARKWKDSNGFSTPVTSMLCEMAGARNLRFSPLGSGEPILVAAEEADFINIIDSKTFKKKQMIDIFGEIAGIDFSEEGHELNVLVSDSRRGGLIQFDRVGSKKLAQWAPHMPSLQPF